MMFPFMTNHSCQFRIKNMLLALMALFLNGYRVNVPFIRRVRYGFALTSEFHVCKLHMEFHTILQGVESHMSYLNRISWTNRYYFVFFLATHNRFDHFRNKSNNFQSALNFARSLWPDFEVGFKYRMRSDLKRLPAVRYALDIFNSKQLSLFQIYSR